MKNSITIAILNWKQYSATKACLKSLQRAGLPNATTIYLIDNESNPSELKKLEQAFPAIKTISHKVNLGFAAAYNHFFDHLIRERSPEDSIVILNNDTEVTPGFVQAMLKEVSPEKKVELIGATTISMTDRKTIESKGVALFRSGLAYFRRESGERLFCPLGAITLYTVNLLQVLKRKTGHYFDPHFFCYTEEVDLAYRAHLLGFKPRLAEQVIIYHHGALSTGGKLNDFIITLSLRNSLFCITKNTPLLLLILHSPFILFLQLCTIFYLFLRGKWSIPFKIYWQYLKALPRLLKQRWKIQKARTITTKEFSKAITPRLYSRSFLRNFSKK